jgi:SAM-dependent methyltransferase
MGLYARYVLPRLIEWACNTALERAQRARVVPHAHGTVLELGFGSGLNLSHYDPARVVRVIGVDPSAEGWQLAARRRARVAFPVEHHPADLTALDLPPGSVDTVLVTWSLCTIPDPLATLRAAWALLRPGGQLVYCEHGLAPDPGPARWQRRIEPVWRRLAGGCRLTRVAPDLLAAAGFTAEEAHAAYLPGAPRWVGYHYWGRALPVGSA